MSNSTNVETNVVQMRFDNKNFEKNVNQTMKSLDELKKELKFDDSAKSFKTLEENAKKVDFSPLSKGIEKVQASFSFLDTFSATVYHRLSNRLIDIGKKVTAGVSTDGIKSGFSEYELKMNSFKTIKASAGKDFTDSQINEYLEELNRYADKTIYSFSDMTNNIGKFTNAGVKLDAAVKAIQGISNEAAVSGATAEQASHAMYNFSQALSAGYVKLIDWKSIENANMATEEFKTQLLETAAELKTVTKAADGTYKTIKKGTTVTATKNFNEALSEQWMTTEVLTKTLAKYADETTEIGKKAFDAAQKVNTFTKLMDTLKESVQSGWSQTWEIVIGDLEEATKLWTSISDKIGGVIDAFFKEKKAVLENWKAHNGRERTLRALSKIMWNIGNALRIVGEAWRSVFPKTTVNNMMALTEALESIANKTRMTKDTSAALKDTFKGLFATVGILLEAFKAFKATFGKFFIRVLADALHTLFGVSGSLGQMLVSVKKSITENRTFYKVFKSIVDVLEWVYSGLKVVTNALWNFAKTVGSVVKDNGGFKAFKSWFDGLKKSISSFDLGGIASSIVGFIKGLWKIIDKTFEKTFNFYKPFKNKITEVKNKIVNSKFGQWVIGFYQDIVNGVQKVFNSFGNIKTDGIDKMNNNAKGKVSVFGKIIGFFTKAWEVIKGIALTIWPYIKDIVKSIGTGIQMLVKGVTENIRNSDMGDAGGLLAGAGVIGIAAALRNFVKGLKPLFDSFSAMGKGLKAFSNLFQLFNVATKLIKAKILKELAISIVLLCGALFLLCTVPTQKLIGATTAMGVLFQGMTAVFKAIDGVNGEITDGDDKKTNKLGKGGAGRLFGIAATLLALSVAMVVLVAAIKKLSKISVEDITKGVIVIMTLFAVLSSAVVSILEVGKFTKTMGAVDIRARGVGGMIKSFGKTLLYIMAAFWILSKIAEKFSKMKDGQQILTKLFVWMMVMIGTIGAIMVLIAKFSKEQTAKSLSVNVKSIKATFGMLGLAMALKSFAIAMVAIMASIAILALIVHKKGMTGEDMSEVIGAMLGAVVIILGAMAAMVGYAKLTKSGDVVRIIGMLAGISIFMWALSNTLLKLSLIPADWAMTGASALGAIAVSLGIVVAALGYFMKSVNRRMNNKIQVKELTKVLGAITLSMLVLSAAVTAMSFAIKAKNVWSVVLLLIAMAGAIALICAAIGKFETFQKGFDGLTKGLAAIGIAAAGFAAAAALIIYTLKQISKMSDAEVNAVGTNMKKIATAILSSADQIIGMLMGLVKMVVETIIGTAVTTIIGSAGEIVDGLLKLCDILLVKAPTLVNKILQILVLVVTEVEKNAGPVVASIVSAVITIISEVAKAIRENADRIINAIDDVLSAIATLVAKGIAKIFSFDEFKGAVRTLEKIVKPVAALLIGMWAYNRVKKGADGILRLLGLVGSKIKTFKTTLKNAGFSSAWREFLGIDKLNESWDIAKTAYKEGWASLGESAKLAAPALLKAAGIGASIGLAIGTTIKGIIDSWADAIDVTTDAFEDINEQFKQTEDELNELLTTIKDSAKERIKYSVSIDYKYDSADQLFKRLQNVMDTATGKVKDGKEDEFNKIADEMQSTLGIRIELEDKIAKIVDEQGNKRTADLETLKQIVELEKFKAKLDKQLEEKEELEKQRKDAATKRDEYKEQYDYYKGLRNDYESGKLTDADIVDQLIEKEFKGDANAFADAMEKVAKTYNMTIGLGKEGYASVIKRYLADAAGDTGLAYNNAKKAADELTKQIQNIEDAEAAYYEGNLEEMQKYSLVFSDYYKTGLTDDQKRKETEKLLENVQKSMDNVEESIYSEVKSWFDTMRLYKKELGESTADLDKMWESYEKEYNEKRGKTDKKTDTSKTETSTSTTSTSKSSGIVNEVKDYASNKLQSVVKSTGVDSGWNKIGEMETLGIVQGQEDASTSSEAQKHIKTTSENLMEYKKKYDKIASPSKLWADEVGKWEGLGIIQGMEDAINSYDPSSMTQGLISKLQSTIFPAIAGLTGNSIPFGGVTPVNFGLNQNGSGIYGTQVPLNGALPYDAHLTNITTILQMHSENMMAQTNTIITEIGLLRGDVTALGAHIDDMELRLDGDALVGGITQRMNDSLMRLSSRTERGL